MPTRRALLVALTGGVASGKSVVAARLARHGVPIVDADVVAREVVAHREPAFAQIAAEFGNGVLHADGSLDRAALRALVFSDPARRARLEALLHPLILERMRAQAAATCAPYVVLAIPLLVESGAAREGIDHVVVVDASEHVQFARLVARDGISEQLARSMIAAQASRAQRLALADDVLRNDGTLDALHSEVDALHERLLARAAALR